MYVRDGGQWKPISEAYVRDTTWKSFFVGSTPFIGTIEPSSDISDTGWITSPIWSVIDDPTSVITATEIDNADTPQVFVFRVHMTDPATVPAGTETVTVRISIGVDMDLGTLSLDDLTVKLFEGATPISTDSDNTGITGLQTFAWNLSEVQKSSVGDWNDIEMEVTVEFQVTTEGDTGTCTCEFAEIEFS